MKHIRIVVAFLITVASAACSTSAVGPTPAFGPLPTISGIAPASGSTYGGTGVVISGAFEQNARATIAGITLNQGYSPATRGSRIYVDSPPHAVGSVDVVVTNPGGRSQTIAGGFSYVDPSAFDFNGSWAGFTNDGSDTGIEFTISGNVLTRVHCTPPDGSTLDVELSAPIANGRVEYVGPEGSFSGWVATSSESAGTINMAPCSLRTWQVERQN